MRILWVEDEASYIKNNRSYLFGDISTRNEVEIETDFSDAYRKLKETPGKYDILVLDINLEHSRDINQAEFDSKLVLPENTNFLQEAGFHLYLTILEQGFPRTRIAFLTANTAGETRRLRELINQFNPIHKADGSVLNLAARELFGIMTLDEQQNFNSVQGSRDLQKTSDWLNKWFNNKYTGDNNEDNYKDTYGEFVRRFKDARLIPPVAFDKKKSSADFQGWLASHCGEPIDREKFYYLTVRRGILDVLEEIQSNPDIHPTADFNNDLDKENFLSGLAWQVRDFALPSNQFDKWYLAVCDYLSKPFERFDGKQLANERDLKLPIYHLRNWIAHGLVNSKNTKITAQFSGIVFLLSIHHIFNVRKYGYADELQRLFSRPVSEPQKWKQACIAFGRKHRVRNSDYGLSLIHHKGVKDRNSRWQHENFIELFYMSYLLCLQQPDNSVSNAPLNPFIAGELSL
jgi:hypothetical protein